MNCPACRSNVIEQEFEGVNGKRVLLDACHTCHGLWFDARESLQLSTNGVLRLFRELHGRRDRHHRLKEPLACPRCRAALVRTNDLARGNKFQYFRCQNGDGHFITFFQFLREKGIVRGLSPKELTELRKHVQGIQCSDCGGPIELKQTSACPACSAPVCILDPKALGSTLSELTPAAAVAGAVVAPAVAAQLLMDKMQMGSFFRRLDTHAQLTASLGSTSAPMANSRGQESQVGDAIETGVDVVEAGVEVVEVVSEGGFDLIDVGVDFFLEIVSGIGSSF